MQLRHVLEPISIGSVEIENRVVRTAHGTNLGDGRINDDLIAYHEARARGGAGLSILEAASVHWTDKGTLRLHDESVVDGFDRLMARMRPHGMRVFQQLGHLGFGGVTMDGSPPWSASDGPGPMRGPVHAMTVDEIAEVTEAWIRAAGWCRDGGLDGVEIHVAHGFLLQQFLSPAVNRRDDEYGGSWDNRMRFVREVVGGVRAEVGADFVVGIRTGAEARDDGVSADECAQVVIDLEADGLLDYVNVSFGSVWVSHKIIGGMIEPPGYELPTSEVVTRVSELPTIVTGRFGSLAEADDVIDRGIADLVGLTRAHIADPDVVRKTIGGRADEVRPCIAANDGCVGGLNRGRLACAVNPDVGFESRRSHEPAESMRRVVIVGAGPAGLETARVAAERGHDVRVLEARERVGGAMVDAAALPHRGLLLDIVGWYEREMRRLGVVVELGVAADVDLISGFEPDVVVVATGAEGGTIPDAVPERVVVIDRHGGYEALGIAEWLADRGSTVALTAAERLGRRVRLDDIVRPTLARLAEKGVDVRRAEVEIVEEGETEIVVEKRSSDHLAGALRATGHEVHLVGDASEPAGHLQAIHAGNELGRRI